MIDEITARMPDPEPEPIPPPDPEPAPTPSPNPQPASVPPNLAPASSPRRRPGRTSCPRRYGAEGIEVFACHHVGGGGSGESSIASTSKSVA
jgi:outer membrane biosynthesis protein TonB